MNSLQFEAFKKRKLLSNSEFDSNTIENTAASFSSNIIEICEDNIIQKYENVEEEDYSNMLEFKQNENLKKTVRRLLKENKNLKRENKSLKENREIGVFKLEEKCIALKQELNSMQSTLDQVLEDISNVYNGRNQEKVDNEDEDDNIYFLESQEEGETVSNPNFVSDVETEDIDDQDNKDIYEETLNSANLSYSLTSGKQQCVHCFNEISLKHMGDHLLIHENEKKFVCDKKIYNKKTGQTRNCTKRFNTSGYLSKHLSLVDHGG